MTNFIPIFPLEIVVFPEEKVNLHIFEDRYVEMISECAAKNKPFGIIPVIKENVAETGTLVEITNMAEIFADGRMNITVKGISVIRTLEVLKTVPDKLYSGAIVSHMENEIKVIPKPMVKILQSLRTLHKLLQVEKNFTKADDELTSYDVAHHAGLSFEQEYEFLNLLKEEQRLEYLRRYLNKALPIAAGIESLKKKIQLNGHFKELKGFNFNK